MYILSHRGMWKEMTDRNSLRAIRESLLNGYGFESDLRDYKGQLVISHDIAGENSPFAESVFEMIKEINGNCYFAINIKADGLNKKLVSLLEKYEITNYFAFDMSVPQMVEYLDMKLRIFTRQSELENKPVLYNESVGVWVDGFLNYDWITQEVIDQHIMNGKQVCIVSPELHKKEYKSFWQRLKLMDIDFTKIMLCTDLPEEANNFFG